MADIYTTATQLAILSAGRTPVWTVQSDTGSLLPPAAALDGTYLEQAVRTLVHVSLREDAHHRTARLTISSLVLSGTYTVSIEGNAVAVGGGVADKAALVDAIVAAINADVTVNPYVTASPEGTPHDTVLIEGDIEADWSINFVHSGAAVVACLADLVGLQLRLWWLPGARVGETPPTVWTWSGEQYDLDRRGIVQRFDSAGLDRLFLQASERVGHSGDGAIVTYTDPVLSVGPCLSEVA